MAGQSRHLIIPAGGTGTRFQSDIPKQFIPLAGKPILMHAIDAFVKVYPEIDIVLVLPGNHTRLWNDMCTQFSFDHPHRIVKGGETRFVSVRNGLEAISASEGVVGVHDGVRPTPGTDLISRCYDSADRNGSAVPVLPLTDSLRKLDESGNSRVENRDEFRTVQTPQCFDLKALRKAYSAAGEGKEFSDDAAVYEAFMGKIHLVEGNPANIKITNPADLHIGEALINRIRLR